MMPPVILRQWTCNECGNRIVASTDHAEDCCYQPLPPGPCYCDICLTAIANRWTSAGLPHVAWLRACTPCGDRVIRDGLDIRVKSA